MAINHHDPINKIFQTGHLITINCVDFVNYSVWDVESRNITMQVIISLDEEDEPIILNEEEIINCNKIFKRFKLTHKSFVFNDGKCKVYLTDKYCKQIIIDEYLCTIKVEEIKMDHER